MDFVSINASTLTILAILAIGFAVLITLLPWLARHSGNLGIGETAKLQKQLRNMALGNDALIERHLQYQRRKNPGGTEAQHLQKIIDDWIKDHNRPY